ncbi:MAG: hypothetical protein GAK43_01795 [Stenotrophomonas maltophilia]|nr:MAG: hypothetical protein GAK43_01795 [Stenotrophomonas maltophilia]
MTAGAALLIVVALMLVGMAALLVGLSLRARHHEVVVGRLIPGELAVDPGRRRSQHWLVQRLRRAGVHNARLWLFSGSALAVLLLLAGVHVFGPVGALAGAALGIGGFLMLLNLLYRRRLKRMIQQMPRFLDQVVRSLHAGRTLGDALEQAVNAADAPLKDVFSTVTGHVQLGISLPESLQAVADLYQVEELHILSLGVAVNYRYGGNTTDLLDNIIKVIHEREKLSRQLRALTGETRLSAFVLAALPLGMGAYILFTNPAYLVHMWLDPVGRWMLIISLGLQALGCYVLWRMLKSV